MSPNGLTLFTSVSTTELARDRVAIWDIDLRLNSFPAHNPSPNEYISWRLQPIPLDHYSHSRGTTVTNIYIPVLFYILPVSTALSAVLCELSPVVHTGFSAACQLITLVYRRMINDLTLCPQVSLAQPTVGRLPNQAEKTAWTLSRLFFLSA